MNDINLPSDNLHKFVAFAGLALVVSSLVISANLIVDLVERSANLNVAIGEIDQELKWHAAKAGKSLEQIKSVPLTDLPLELVRTSGRLSAQRKSLEELVQMESRVILGASVIIVFGLICFGYGLQSWRTQQRKHDLLLDHQIKLISDPNHMFGVERT
ncbi:MAG: hypothetical protein KatS3mg104_0772 [Phycisphaerae bacterium]|nr:MAG: hypothetical protein KatS3mg104_0772 [Phycisphaerae bacterium]